MVPYFWLKTALDLLIPGGIGYNRKLRQFKDNRFDLARDKHEVRAKHHGQGGWKQNRVGGLLHREYENYQEYVTHQIQKFNEILKMQGGFDKKTVLSYRLTFYRRFRVLKSLLSPDARILCAGARQGTEVEVLRELGFKNAFGIDLNPGPENPFVKVGDFMKIDEADNSIDMIYCNAVDHAFNLDQFFREHARILKPDGIAYYDVSTAKSGAFEAIDWESEEIVFQEMLKHFNTVLSVSMDRFWKSIILKGKRTPSVNQPA